MTWFGATCPVCLVFPVCQVAPVCHVRPASPACQLCHICPGYQASYVCPVRPVCPVCPVCDMCPICPVCPVCSGWRKAYDWCCRDAQGIRGLALRSEHAPECVLCLHCCVCKHHNDVHHLRHGELCFGQLNRTATSFTKTACVSLLALPVRPNAPCVHRSPYEASTTS